ncbi:MAG: membrane protein insertion efficiency factor YidD [Opitutales bacterium]
MRIKRFVFSLLRLPSKLAVGVICLYQMVLSPLATAFFGPAACCRFYPSCSSYARESLVRHGFFLGCFLALVRLLKCHPYHSGGCDPVPERVRIFPRSLCGEKERGEDRAPE